GGKSVANQFGAQVVGINDQPMKLPVELEFRLLRRVIDPFGGENRAVTPDDDSAGGEQRKGREGARANPPRQREALVPADAAEVVIVDHPHPWDASGRYCFKGFEVGQLVDVSQVRLKTLQGPLHRRRTSRRGQGKTTGKSVRPV